ncbi:MAG: response regulator [Anaerolineae bacterium]
MKKRILYVEDNPNNMLLVKRILRAEGHEMLEAVDGESGWELTRRERPDFILMDLFMPGMDGFELTRKIKDTPDLSHIPIVVLTAYGSPETEAKAVEAGCDGFLHKPADIRQIRAVIRQFLDEPET